MKEAIRKARSGELGTLKNIWKTVFGDTDAFIDAFFRHYADTATIVQIGGEVAAAGYLLSVGKLDKHPCAMIYSVAVLPEFRSRGLGAELTRALIESGYASGYPAVILCPASDGLFDYYSSRTAMREWFYASERMLTAPVPVTGGDRLVRVTAAEYLRLRGELLRGVPHVELDERAISFQSDICGLGGGGLFAIGDACTIVERNGETVNVKELLAVEGAMDAAAAVMDAFPADRYVVRSPVCGDENARRFGMLAASPVCPEPYMSQKGAWFGLAFD